jgi:atypical dual specificity phosphatase
MLETQGTLTWIVPDVLAAMGRPYDLRKAVELFKDAGIGVVISLTETALNTDILAEFDIEYHHIPVDDFRAPDAAQVERFVSIVAAARQAGRKTVAHCFAGRGRSGAMAACYLVSLGRTPEEALAEVRSLRPGAVETEAQEEAVHDYAKHLRQKRGRRGSAG